MASTLELDRTHSLPRAPHDAALTREQEHELAQRWRQHGDESARERLIRAQLPNVVAIARKYRRNGGASVDELIAEGNFGLLRALDKFDPERGTRFVTYAVYWVRAYISQYLLRSRSVVTAGVHSRVHSKIRQARRQILAAQGETPHLNQQLAVQLALSPARLDHLLERMNTLDFSWEYSAQDEGSSYDAAESELVNAEEALMASESGRALSLVVAEVTSTLDDRERYIVQHRLMAHDDDELSLADIGRHFGFSRERARQLEARAIRKIKRELARSPEHIDWLVDLAA